MESSVDNNTSQVSSLDTNVSKLQSISESNKRSTITNAANIKKISSQVQGGYQQQNSKMNKIKSG